MKFLIFLVFGFYFFFNFGSKTEISASVVEPGMNNLNSIDISLNSCWSLATKIIDNSIETYKNIDRVFSDPKDEFLIFDEISTKINATIFPVFLKYCRRNFFYIFYRSIEKMMKTEEAPSLLQVKIFIFLLTIQLNRYYLPYDIDWKSTDDYLTQIFKEFLSPKLNFIRLTDNTQNLTEAQKIFIAAWDSLLQSEADFCKDHLKDLKNITHYYSMVNKFFFNNGKLSRQFSPKVNNFRDFVDQYLKQLSKN